MEIKCASFTGERDEAKVKEKAKYGLIISSVWLKLKWSFTHSHHLRLTKAAEGPVDFQPLYSRNEFICLISSS